MWEWSRWRVRIAVAMVGVGMAGPAWAQEQAPSAAPSLNQYPPPQSYPSPQTYPSSMGADPAAGAGPAYPGGTGPAYPGGTGPAYPGGTGPAYPGATGSGSTLGRAGGIPGGGRGDILGFGAAGTAGPAGVGAPASAFDPASGGGGGGYAPNLGGFAGGPEAPPGIIGDLSPPIAITGLPQPPPIPPPSQPSSPGVPSTLIRSQLAPSVRGFKIAENQSPFPQDRLFFSFNYFNDVNASLNRHFESPIRNLSIYRYVFGYEKTYLGGRGSIGVRLPLNTFHADTAPGLINTGGQSTALGNATFFTKYILGYNPKTGNMASVGLAVTPPTGPGVFAGAKGILGSLANKTTIQPFVGYYINLTDRLFLQGFSALDVPTNEADVTLFYNDLALGYYAYRDREASGITAIVPTFEVHVNTPLNHQNAYSLADRSGTADSVNLTGGVNIEFRRNSVFTFGVVTPTTGPRPFNLEAVALFNYRFGGPRRAQRVTPIIGG